MPGPRRTRRPLIALIVLLLILVVGYTVQALRDGSSGPTPATSTRSSTASSSGGLPGSLALSSLPAPAGTTMALIRSGGPFPYARDGVVFGNVEHRLPGKPPGYYHEYTVTTPGEPDRGARRIITGRAGEFYYTGDHYETFVRVDAAR